MSNTQDFNAPAQVTETREFLKQRLGEIITGILGDARVQDLFEQSGGHPKEHKGKPTGIIALNMGVITPATKTALLVAQAAERAYVLAEKAEELAREANDRIKAKD